MISFEEYCNQYPQQMPLIPSCSDPHLHPLLNHCCFHSLPHCHSLIFNSKKINLNPRSDFEKSPFLSSMAVHVPKKSLSMKVNLLNKIQLLLNQAQTWEKKKEKKLVRVIYIRVKSQCKAFQSISFQKAPTTKINRNIKLKHIRKKSELASLFERVSF